MGSRPTSPLQQGYKTGAFQPSYKAQGPSSQKYPAADPYAWKNQTQHAQHPNSSSQQTKSLSPNKRPVQQQSSDLNATYSKEFQSAPVYSDQADVQQSFYHQRESRTPLISQNKSQTSSNYQEKVQYYPQPQELVQLQPPTSTGKQQPSSKFYGNTSGHGQQQYARQNQSHQNSSETPPVPPQGDRYSNPKTVFFHVIFKGLALFFYIFGGWFTSYFVLQFVCIVVLAAIDFWIVKNVSGRILVGLRYWNENDEHGNSIWRFESLDQPMLERLNKKDSQLFWTTLYVIPAFWTLLGIIALIKFNFDYLIIILLALAMCISNIIGFTKCQKDAKKRAQNFAQQAMGGFMQEALRGTITNNISKILNVF